MSLSDILSQIEDIASVKKEVKMTSKCLIICIFPLSAHAIFIFLV